MPYTKYIQNEQHYKEVLSKAEKVKEALWIGTADIKDLYVGDKPFLEVLAKLLQRSVEVRLIHAKEPGPIFREEFDRYPILFKNLERVLCPRVHFKMMIFDYREAYIGSANLTGVGIDAKGANKRNFEAGILTDEISILDAATEQFDAVWRGAHCKACLRRDVCGAPIV
jgi:phosphatidylserine/phosphatidylglycerophosphate/cardiolipin synthase-like enzyme